ncbi:MAG: MmgE/PrpD family protein [Conexibacter sp.]|nr:MmgE/PrpD family protein [Conexibacter sp.]
MSTTELRESTVGARLGRFAAGVVAETLPAEVVEKLRCNLLHDLACATAAHTVGPDLWALVRDRRPDEATLLCDGGRVGAEYAAFVNAQLIHARAQDDTHFAAKTHVGAAVVPAVLALAERDGADGAAVLTAIVAGCEVAAAVGERLAAASTARGFRASPVFGTLGAAAASASVLGLDAAATSDAIALAASFCGGLNQTWIDGTPEWRFELGMAARNGVLAAQLAANGFHGAPHWYEGAAGFARAFAGVEPGTEPDADWQLGERWRLLDVTYKPYPVCAITQSPVQVAIDLVVAHDLDPAELTAVRCFLNPQDRTYPGTVNPGPYRDVGATLMSAEYCVAMALKTRGATLAGLHAFDDPVIARLVSVTEVLPDERLPSLGGRVELETAGGATLAGELIPDAGTYGWDWEGVRANVVRMEPEMAVSRAQLDRLEAAVRELAELDSVAPLLLETVPRSAGRIA